MGTHIGNFEIIEQIASGGMAVIYKARQTTLDRLVVIKELKSAFKEDKEIIARFEQEAKAVAKLQHENIINVIEFWHKGGSYYIAMEYLEGADLAKMIEYSGPLPLNIGLIVAADIARALEYAHERGIVHRDLKPSNILISREGKVKLTDFGIAHIEEELGGKGLTRAGLYMGTPAYMSPEQTDGKPAEPSSDIWSFGCVLYEIFSGQKAFADQGKSTLMENIRKGRMTPQSPGFRKTVPWGLRRWINQCLRNKPEKRPSIQRLSAYLLAIAQKENKARDYSLVLQDFFGDKGGNEPVQAKTTVMRKPPADRSAKKLYWPVAAAVIAAVLAVIVYSIIESGRPATIAGLRLKPGQTITSSAMIMSRMSMTAVQPPAASSRAVVPVSPSAIPESVKETSQAGTKVRPAALPVAGPPAPPVASGQSAAPAEHPHRAETVQKPVVQKFGYIRVVALPWAEIYIDGKKAGLTPTDRNFRVSAGTHRVFLKNPYYGSVHRIVRVSGNKLVLIKADLTKGRKKR